MMRRRIPQCCSKSYDSKHFEWLARTCEKLDRNEWSNELPVSLDGSCWDEELSESTSIRFFCALKDNKSVRSLHLRNLNMGLKGERAFEDMLRQNQSLTSIRVNKVKLPLPEALFEKKNLKELDIEGCELDLKSGKALARMIKYSRSLRVLKLSNLTLSDSVAYEFATALELVSSNSTFNHLVLDGISCCEKIMKQFLDSVAENSSLQSLHINDSSVGWANVDGLVKILASNKSLIEISACGNNLDGQCIKALTEEGLYSNTTLASLLLDRNPIGDDGAIYLADALQVNSTLKVLSLEDTEIWQDGSEYFSRLLATMPGLRKVILDGNDFEVQIDILLHSMKKNMMVTQLFITMAPLLLYNYDERCKKKWEMVDLYLRSNRANRRILKESQIPHSLWTKVFEKASAEPDTMHFLLRSAPELFCKA